VRQKKTFKLNSLMTLQENTSFHSITLLNNFIVSYFSNKFCWGKN